MKRVILHIGDQVFPVPLDPDLLSLALNARQQNIIQDIYRMQAERDRFRLGDADQPRDEDGKFAKAGKSKVTRVNVGHYELSHGGKQYKIQRQPDGAWLTYEIRGHENRHDYLNDYVNKRSALKSITGK